MPTTVVLLALLAAGPAQAPVIDAEAARLAEAARIVAAQRQQLGAMTIYYGNRATVVRRPLSLYLSTARPSMISPYRAYPPLRPALPPAAVLPGGVLPAVPPAAGLPGGGNGIGVGAPPPPAAPAAQNAAATFTEQEQAEAQTQREWLMARLKGGPQLDAQTLRAAEQDLARMNPSQLRTLVETYKQWQEQQRATAPTRQQDVLSQAQLNLQQSIAFRNHLSREFQLRLLEQHALLNALNSGYGYGYGYGGGLSGYGGGLPYAPFNPPVPFGYGYAVPYGW